jgi:hypothetical protein
MEDIIAVMGIFIAGPLVLLSFSPVGRAFADRIRHGRTPGAIEPDPAVYDELERMRQEMGELAERVDFAERLLAERAEPREIKG